ncbi:hypothetical protein [Blastococcus sp. SYSU DS0616]
MSARQLFCLSGVRTYGDGDTDLIGVPDELRTMRRALASLGLVEHLPFDEEERSHEELAEGLWRDVVPEAETLVIYCTGHGIGGGRYGLVQGERAPFPPGLLIQRLENWTNLREVLLIIDACYAEQGVDAALQEARTATTRTARMGFWGIGASRRLEEARQGAFATGFAARLAARSVPSWTVSHLDPGRVAAGVDRELGSSQNVWLTGGHPAQPCRALPNPRHQTPTRPTRLPLPTEWAARARGVASADLPGFFFTGRVPALHALREHLVGEDGNRIAVVTGGPGSGRSALLGQLVLTTHPDGRGAMPAEARSAWPAPAVTIAAATGDPGQVTGALRRLLAPSEDAGELVDVLRSAPKPLAIVLDDLDEADGPEPWTHFFDAIGSVAGVRLVVGLPTSSALWPAESPPTLDLDAPELSPPQDVRDYVGLQVRLALPDAPSGVHEGMADLLAERAGDTFEVAVELSVLSTARLEADDYVARASRVIGAAARRVAHRRLAGALDHRAGAAVVSSLSALCAYDAGVALDAVEWAAAATAPEGPPVEEHDVVTSARLLRSLVEHRPGADGTSRWRARFQLPTGGVQREPEDFLRRLPQVSKWDAVDWTTVDPGIQALVARAAASRLIPGRLLDDPAFLLGAPPALVSQALQTMTADRAERARRSSAWRVVPRHASAADRALLLRIGAQRFQVHPLVSAFGARRLTPIARLGGHDYAVDWVQPDQSLPRRLVHMVATPPCEQAAVVAVHDDDTVAFWDPTDGAPTRSPVSIPGAPRDVAVAVVAGTALALISTWRHEIWLVPCRGEAGPTHLPHLTPRPTVGPTAPWSSLLVAVDPRGRVVVASGTELWTGHLGSDRPLRRWTTLDSDVLAVRMSEDDEEPVVWVVPESGRLRRLDLDGASRSMTPFPVPRRPLAAAVSSDGNRALILDVAGALHLRGTTPGGSLPAVNGTTALRAVAVGRSTAIIGGGPNGQPGWLTVHDLEGGAVGPIVPVDQGVVGLALHGEDVVLVARESGVLAMKRVGAGRSTEPMRNGGGHQP